MRGIILMGGSGSRLEPLSDVTNKHLLPVGNLPMGEHALLKLVEGKYIKDICIVCGKEHAGSIINYFGSGVKWDCNITYKIQDEAGGISEALLLCEDFAKNENVVVILGDNITLSTFIWKYFDEQLENIEVNDGKNRAFVFLKETQDAKRFGVPTFEDEKIIKITEKPENPDSFWAVTGFYIFNNEVWDYIKNTTYSDRGEMEIVDVLNQYIENGHLSYSYLNSPWTDAGTLESYKHANNLINRLEN